MTVPEHFEYESAAAPRAESLKWARWQLARLNVAEVSDLDGVEAGACDECGVSANVRHRVGRFALCLACTIRRRRVAQKLRAAA